MTSNSHIIRTESNGEFVGWCGYRQRSNFRFTTKPDRSDICPKCSAAYYKTQLGKDFPYRLADRLELSGDDRRFDYKSIYPIIRQSNEEVVGFVTIRNGWGPSWGVHALESNVTLRDVRAGVVQSPTMCREGVRYAVGGYERLASGNSKEEILFLVPTLIEQRKLPSQNELREVAVGHIKDFERQLAAQDARKAEQAENLQLIADEFAGLLGLGTLTNRQRTAITMAAEQLGIKIS